MQDEEKSPRTVRENGILAQMKRDVLVVGNLRVLCVCAMLAAMSLILGKFLQIPNPFQEVIRISFENLPVIMAGVAFGPIMGLMTGVVADLLGCLMYGYTINPIITLGAGAAGLAAGVVASWLLRRFSVFRVIAATVAAHLLGSVLIKSLGLAAWYLSSYQMGLWELIAWRLLTYAIVGTAECVILCLLFRRRAFTSQLERMRRT
jgi:ECF transporter S component (folate family)